MADGNFSGFKAVHPTTGAAAHDVRVVAAGGQATLLCITCETYQTVDSISSGAPIIEKEA